MTVKELTDLLNRCALDATNKAGWTGLTRTHDRMRLRCSDPMIEGVMDRYDYCNGAGALAISLYSDEQVGSDASEAYAGWYVGFEVGWEEEDEWRVVRSSWDGLDRFINWLHAQPDTFSVDAPDAREVLFMDPTRQHPDSPQEILARLRARNNHTGR